MRRAFVKADGHAKSSFHYLRRRKPEERRPRRCDPLRAETLQRRLKEVLERLHQRKQ
jgi:hypothetical protein